MKIQVLSSGRAQVSKQHTLTSIPATVLRDVELVVQEKQAGDYRPVAKHFGCQLVVLPTGLTGLSNTRQWLLDRAIKRKEARVLQLDDDLRLFKRRADDQTKFVRCTDKQVEALLREIEKRLLDGYAHVGVLSREGGNRVTAKFLECTRMTRVLAYDVSKVKKAGARFDRVPSKQDFDMTLQLLRAGLKNIVLCEYVHDQPGSNSPGGCSVYRDDAMHRKTSALLATLHPGFVKVVTKSTKTAWGGGERVDVTIQWKKAFESSGRET